jgi:hypothetical protein
LNHKGIEFLKLIESVDSEMRHENVPIHARPLQAVMRIARKLKIQLMTAPPDETTKLIYDWFDNKYGNRLKIDFSPGELAFLLRNDLFKFKFPKIWGRFTLKADTTLFNKKRKSFEYAKAIDHLEINPLHFIVDFTETLAKSLTPSELEVISRLFRQGVDSFEFIRAASNLTLVKGALGDLHASVAHLFTNPPQHGQSKWASLQATEKLLKAYIKKRGQEPEYVHNLKMLADEANRLGMVKFRPDAIEKIQCKAGVRYGAISVSLLEAIEAHHAALNICAGAALIILQE